MSETMILKVVEGKDSGLQITVPSTGATLGRAPDCDIKVSDPTVSKKHCRFVLEPRGWVVHDLGSRSGVIINGRKTTGHPVTGGDELKLGNLRLKVVTPPMPIAAPVPRPPTSSKRDHIQAPQSAPESGPPLLPPAIKKGPKDASKDAGNRKRIVWAKVLGGILGWMVCGLAAALLGGLLNLPERGFLDMLVRGSSSLAGAWVGVWLAGRLYTVIPCPVCGGSDITVGVPIVDTDNHVVVTENEGCMCQSCESIWIPKGTRLGAVTRVVCSGFVVLLYIGVVAFFIYHNRRYNTLVWALGVASALFAAGASYRIIYRNVQILLGKGGGVRIVRQGVTAEQSAPAVCQKGISPVVAHDSARTASAGNDPKPSAPPHADRIRWPHVLVSLAGPLVALPWGIRNLCTGRVRSGLFMTLAGVLSVLLLALFIFSPAYRNAYQKAIGRSSPAVTSAYVCNGTDPLLITLYSKTGKGFRRTAVLEMKGRLNFTSDGIVSGIQSLLRLHFDDTQDGWHTIVRRELVDGAAIVTTDDRKVYRLSNFSGTFSGRIESVPAVSP